MTTLLILGGLLAPPRSACAGCAEVSQEEVYSAGLNVQAITHPRANKPRTQQAAATANSAVP